MANERRLATVTLVLTPGLLEDFGTGIQDRERFTTDPWSRAAELYNHSKKRNFERSVRSKSPDKFQERWTRGVLDYAETYDQILWVFSDALGPSKFKLAYQRAIAISQLELQHISFAVHDISEVYRRHIAHSINVATHYDELFAVSDPRILHNLEAWLRTSNYGITLLFLLLSGDIPGPLWIVFKTHELIQQCLSYVDKAFNLPSEPKRIGGSLKIREGEIGLLNKKPGK